MNLPVMMVALLGCAVLFVLFYPLYLLMQMDKADEKRAQQGANQSARRRVAKA